MIISLMPIFIYIISFLIILFAHQMILFRRSLWNNYVIALFYGLDIFHNHYYRILIIIFILIFILIIIICLIIIIIIIRIHTYIIILVQLTLSLSFTLTLSFSFAFTFTLSFSFTLLLLLLKIVSNKSSNIFTNFFWPLIRRLFFISVFFYFV